MKKYLRNLLALLLCAALLCGALTAVAEEVEIELEGTEVTDVVLPDEELDIEVLPESDPLDLEEPEIMDDSLSNEISGGDVREVAQSPIKNEEDIFDISDAIYGVVTLWHYNGSDSNVVIPEGVERIDEGAFRRKEYVKHVTIPESVRIIDDWAFADSGIERIEIPGSVKEIGKSVFRDCDALVTATLMEGITEIPKEMFYYCDALQTVNLPDSVEVIDEDAFCACNVLENISLGDNVKVIGAGAFAGCAIKEVYLSENLVSLGGGAFSGCNKLESLTIPKSISDFSGIGGCGALKSLIILGSMGDISTNAFSHMPSLETFELADGPKNIGFAAFDDCPKLKNVSLPDCVESIEGHCFNACTALEEIVLPKNLKSIGSQAFDGCSSLKSVILPEGLKKIDDYAFFNCLELKKVRIPASVTEIGVCAFGKYNDPIFHRFLTVEDFTICGKVGSAAEEYAKENGFTFEGDPVEPKSVTITTGKSAELEAGKKLQLETSLKPEFATTTFTWKSSNKKVATVNSKGLVKAVAKGQATITVTTKNGKTASIKVKVVAATPTRITINQGKSATLYMGSTLKLTTKLAPAKAESKLTWSSSKPAVATVSSKGVVTPKKAGTAKITVKTANGKKASITVKVVDAQSVKLKEGKSKTLKVGKKLTLHATVSPAKVKTKLTWSSSNAKVAAVSSKGVVTAKKAGTAKITVKTANGKSATITITVK